MTDLTNIFARSIKDLTLLPQLPNDLTVLDQVKIPVGNLPVGLNGCEALSIQQLRTLVYSTLNKDIENIEQKVDSQLLETQQLVDSKLLETQTDVESQLSETKTTVESQLSETKTTVDFQLSENKTYTDQALAQLSTAANKFYPTLAEANASIATLAVNQPVTIGESINGGLWYKATAGATSLTKSPYDPLTQAQAYIGDKNTILKNSLSKQDETFSAKFANIHDAEFSEYVSTISLNKSVNTAYTAIAKVIATALQEGNNTLRTLTLSQNGLPIFSDTILPSEAIVNGVKKSIYQSVSYSTGLSITNVVDLNANQVRIDLKFNTINPDLRTNASFYNVFEKSGVFYPQRWGVDYDVEKKYVQLHSTAKTIVLYIPKAEFSGYSISTSGANSYILDKYPNLSFYYATTVTYSLPYLTTIELSSGNFTVSTDATTFKIDLYKKPELVINGVFDEFICDVTNDSAYNYDNHCVELKIDFEKPIAKSKTQLLIEDEDGNTYKAQFIGAKSNNLRERASIGYYPDGSYKTGSIFFFATIAANTKKKFKLKVGKYVKHDNTSKVVRESVGFSVKAYNSTYFFFDGTSILYKVASGSTNVTVASILRLNEWITSTQTQVTMYARKDAKISVIETGDVFTDIEVVATTTAGTTIPEDAFETTYNYRIFANGQIQVKTQTSANIEIAPEKLFNQQHDFSVVSPNATKDTVRVAATMADNLPNRWSFAATIVNGDTHREGIGFGVERPPSCFFPTDATRVRAILGWLVATPNEASFKQYKVLKNWTWTTELWLHTNEQRTDPAIIAKATPNRPVGFLYKQYAPNVLIEKINRKMYDIATPFAKWWVSDDATASGGGANIRNTYFHPFSYELGRYLSEGKGDFDEIYNRFKTVMTARYGSWAGLGDRYLSGGFATALIFVIVTTPLELFYKAAVKLGKTAIADDAKIAINSLARGMATKANSNNGHVTILGNSATGSKAAMNLQTVALYHFALAIYVGADTDGVILSAFNTVENTLKTPTASDYFPIILDDQWENKTIASRNYLIYQSVGSYTYMNACQLINRTPVFNLTNQFIRAINADGRYDDINYCVSESRRGIINLAATTARTLTLSNTLSSLAAAYKSVKVGGEDWVRDMTKTTRLYGFIYQHGDGVEDVEVQEFTRFILYSVTSHILKMINDIN